MKQKTRTVRPNALEVRLGNVLEWSIQSWVSTTGRKVRIAEAPWLEGPIGNNYIGAEFYDGYAREVGLDAVTDDDDAGLLPNFYALAGERFDPSLVHSEIRDFYERTARYDLFAQIGWSGPFKHPPRTLIYLVGRNVGQFDIPLSLSTVEMENELIQLVTRPRTRFPAWLAQAVGVHRGGHARRPVYHLRVACRLRRFFKGVYPLPGGSATTIFRPENGPDGSFALVSDGRRFGEAGYYRIHRTDGGALRVMRVPMEETIHVFVDSEGVLQARHAFALLRARFLDLHYEISRRGS